MSVNIYTTGSAEFLELMLNASAMITGSGTTEDLARIGMMIGLLLLGFQAVFNGQGISFQKAGLMLVLYLIFYGPTTTAVIQDTTSGQVRIVDNVPLGPTFVGSLISTVAYEITRVSEQAFSTPTMTDYGLFSSLSTIARTRDALRNPMGLDSFANHKISSGWDFPKTVDEFMTFCVLNPIALREYASVDQLYRAGSTGAVMSAPLSSQYVYVYDGAPGGRLVSCSQAQSIVNAEMAIVFTNIYDDILNKGFAPERAANRMNTGGEVQGRINDAIQSMAISAKTSQGYVSSALILPIFGDSRVNALNHWQEKNAAMALRESINQQEMQWAAKGDLFKHYMRPMIAFFEGLLYAMTPFMAFALVLGSPGLSILGKYLILPLAVGLWMPLLSIVNAFTLWYANAELSAILNSYDPTGEGFAMLQVLEMDQAISKALGIGGLLAASVPPLALFIVSGSAMVMNGIMGQTTQGDKFKSEDVIPRAKNQSPVMDTTSTYSSDQLTTGANVTGAPAVAEKISAQAAASALVQSTQTESHAATQNYQRNLSSAVESVAATSQGRQTLAGLGNQVSDNLNLSQNSQYTEAASKLSGLGWSQDQIAAGTFAAHVGGQVPMGAAGTKLEESEQFKQMNNQQQQETKQAMQQLGHAVQASSTDQTIMQSGETFTNASQNSLSQKATETLASSLTDAKMAQTAFSKASAMQEVFSAGQSMDLKQAAGASIGKAGTREEGAQRLAEMAGRTESGRAAMRTAMESPSIQALSTDPNEQMAMSAIRALNQDGRLGDLVNSEISPFDFNVNAGNAMQNQGVGGGIPDTRSLPAAVEMGYRSANEAYTNERDMNHAGLEAMRNDGPVVVAAAQSNSAARVAESADHEHSRMVELQEQSPLPQVDTTLNSTTAVSDGAKGLVSFDSSNTIVRGVQQVFSPVTSAVSSGIDKLKELSDSKSNRPPNMND